MDELFLQDDVHERRGRDRRDGHRAGRKERDAKSEAHGSRIT